MVSALKMALKLAGKGDIKPELTDSPVQGLEGIDFPKVVGPYAIKHFADDKGHWQLLGGLVVRVYRDNVLRRIVVRSDADEERVALWLITGEFKLNSDSQRAAMQECVEVLRSGKADTFWINLRRLLEGN